MDPDARRIEIRQATSFQNIRGRSREGFGLVARLAPVVQVHGLRFPIQEESRRILRIEAERLPGEQIDLGRGRGVSHLAFDHRDDTPVFLRFQADARAANEDYLRARHRQRQGIVALGLAGKICQAAIQREQGDPLAGGKPRVIGDLALGIRPQTPRAAFVQLNFEPRRRPRAYPCGFHQRQVAFRRQPRIGSLQLRLHVALEFSQPGVPGLSAEQDGGE